MKNNSACEMSKNQLDKNSSPGDDKLTTRTQSVTRQSSILKNLIALNAT